MSCALAAARKLYGKSFNPEVILNALSCFDGRDLQGLPADGKLRLAAAAKAVDLYHLPRLAPYEAR